MYIQLGKPSGAGARSLPAARILKWVFNPSKTAREEVGLETIMRFTPFSFGVEDRGKKVGAGL